MRERKGEHRRRSRRRKIYTIALGSLFQIWNWEKDEGLVRPVVFLQFLYSFGKDTKNRSDDINWSARIILALFVASKYELVEIRPVSILRGYHVPYITYTITNTSLAFRDITIASEIFFHTIGTARLLHRANSENRRNHDKFNSRCEKKWFFASSIGTWSRRNYSGFNPRSLTRERK